MLVNDVKDRAIFLIDVNGYILSWNHGVEYISGYREEEVIGKQVSVLYKELNSDQYLMQCLDQALKNGKYEKKDVLERKNKSLYEVQVEFTPVNDGDNLIGFATLIRNVEVVNGYLNPDTQKGISVQTKRFSEASGRIHHGIASADLTKHNKNMEQQCTYIVSRNLPAPVANIKGLTELLQGMKVNDHEYDALLDALSVCASNLDKVIADLTQILHTGR
nr:PAS domain S-box protein [Mucilaginibacter sp. Bleaf8]